MTDGQWLYMMTHMAVDDEQQFEKLCQKCKNDSTKDKCHGCGKVRDDGVNDNFDEEKFEKLKNQSVVKKNGVRK